MFPNGLFANRPVSASWASGTTISTRFYNNKRLPRSSGDEEARFKHRSSKPPIKSIIWSRGKQSCYVVRQRVDEKIGDKASNFHVAAPVAQAALVAHKIRTAASFSRVVGRIFIFRVQRVEWNVAALRAAVNFPLDAEPPATGLSWALAHRTDSTDRGDRGGGRAKKDFYTPAGNSWDKLDRNSSAWNILSISTGDPSVACHGRRHFIARLHTPFGGGLLRERM